MSTVGRRCPPFCRSNCKIEHHPLLISLVNCDESSCTGPASANPYAALHALVRKYEQNGQWSKDKDIPDELPEYRYPLLHWASALGKIDLVKFLIGRGFPATCRKRDSGDTALHRGLLCLQQTCHKDASKKFRELLVVLQSVLLVQNNRGNTVLHTCSHYLHKEMPKVDYYAECINLIVSHAVKVEGDVLRKLVNCQNGDGSTALHILAQHDRNLPSLKFLLDVGKAVLTVVNDKNLTPLDVAINDGSMKTSNFLNGLKEAATSQAKNSPGKNSPTGKKSASTPLPCPPAKKIKLEVSSAVDQQNSVSTPVIVRNSEDTQLNKEAAVEQKENGTTETLNAETAPSTVGEVLTTVTVTEAVPRSCTPETIQTTASLVDLSFSPTLINSTPQAASTPSNVMVVNESTPLAAIRSFSSSFGNVVPVGEKNLSSGSRKSIIPSVEKTSAVVLSNKTVQLDNKNKLSGGASSVNNPVKNGVMSASLTQDSSVAATAETSRRHSVVEGVNEISLRMSEETSPAVDENAGGDARHGSSLFAYLKICDFGHKKSIKDTLLNDKAECTKKMQQIANEKTEMESSMVKKTQETETKQRQLRILLQKVDEIQKSIQVLVNQTNHLHQTLLQKNQHRKALDEKLKTINLALNDLDTL